MLLHVPALPHTDITPDYFWCAYSAKVARLGEMLHAHGHQMVLYSSERYEAVCAEHVTVVSDADRERWFGGPWSESVVFDRWDVNDPCWTEMNANVIAEIAQRIEPEHGIGAIAGWCQNPITQAFPHNPCLEWGVGYPGILPHSHRAFESNAWRSFCTGQAASDDVRNFDTVINNAYSMSEFLPPREHDGYLLFVGRPTERKGLGVVRELAQRFPVKCAGQSDPQIPNAEYVGLVRGEEKAKLFSGAVALLAPTTYHPPYEGVCVEAQLAGIPALTTDHGAFCELVTGIGGFRCSTLKAFCDAATTAWDYDLATRQAIADRARGKWSLEAVGPLYSEWLNRVDSLRRGGWYADVPEVEWQL